MTKRRVVRQLADKSMQSPALAKAPACAEAASAGRSGARREAGFAASEVALVFALVVVATLGALFALYSAMNGYHETLTGLVSLPVP